MSEQAEILRGLSSLPAKASAAHERRGAVRHAREGRLTIFHIEAGRIGQPMQVGFRDLSASGIGIVHPQPMKKGDRFLLGLRQGDEKITLATYRAVRCEPGRREELSVGAELVSVLRGSDIARNANLPGLDAARAGKHLLARLNDRTMLPG